MSQPDSGKKIICLFKLIQLPKDVDQLKNVVELIKPFSADSLEAFVEPAYQDDPDCEYSFRFVQRTDSYSARASVNCIDSSIHFMITALTKGPEEPFTDALAWDSINRFEQPEEEA